MSGAAGCTREPRTARIGARVPPASRPEACRLTRCGGAVRSPDEPDRAFQGTTSREEGRSGGDRPRAAGRAARRRRSTEGAGRDGRRRRRHVPASELTFGTTGDRRAGRPPLRERQFAAGCRSDRRVRERKRGSYCGAFSDRLGSPRKREPRLRHPGPSLVRRCARFERFRSNGSAAQTSDPVTRPSGAPPARRPGVGFGARFAHCTRPKGSCQVTRSSDLNPPWLTEE